MTREMLLVSSVINPSFCLSVFVNAEPCMRSTFTAQLCACNNVTHIHVHGSDVIAAQPTTQPKSQKLEGTPGEDGSTYDVLTAQRWKGSLARQVCNNVTANMLCKLAESYWGQI